MDNTKNNIHISLCLIVLSGVCFVTVLVYLIPLEGSLRLSSFWMDKKYLCGVLLMVFLGEGIE